MRRATTSLVFLVNVLIAFSQQNVQFIISSLPFSNSNDSNVFISGSFNAWDPHGEAYRFKKNENGSYFFRARLARGSYEFKITRGGWDKVECSENGSDIPNRFLNITADTVIEITIKGWKDNFKMKKAGSTASKNVHFIDSIFRIPQLNRHRRIWIYLPPGYAKSHRHYPVLYMQDGQNIFDASTSFAGEWGVDETLDSISAHRKEMIVVAVDNGGVNRINEYSPYDMDKYGKGEGKEYVKFLVKTLKPFIDKNYRTRKDKHHTFIAGSSMGGVISMFALLEYPEVFGGAGIFSPAFWVAPKIFEDIKTKGARVKAKIYFYCGGQENEMMQADVQKAFEQMRAVSNSKMTCVIRPDGKHSESVWREEFPLFYLWLMSE